MRHLRLPDYLGLCEVDGRLLMLNVRSDRYLELDPASAEAFRSWLHGEPVADDPGLDRLIRMQMLVPADRPDRSGWTERTAPERSLVGDLPPARRAWPLVAEVAARIWAARRRISQGLEAAVEHVRRTRPASKSGDVRMELPRFRAARRLVPLKPNCLPDSLALAAFLFRRDIGCQLVFGVKLDAFAAHCWLEIDGAVLNESADSVAGFTPIMVI